MPDVRGNADLHVLSLKHSGDRIHLLPGIRRFQAEFLEDIRAYKHHRIDFRQRQSVTAPVVAQRGGGIFPKTADHVVKIGKLAQIGHRMSNRQIDRFIASQKDCDIRRLFASTASRTLVETKDRLTFIFSFLLKSLSISFFSTSS